jgi:hypothetical protein
MIRDARRHRGSTAQRFVNAEEIAEVTHNAVAEALPAFRRSVREPSEPARLHSAARFVATNTTQIKASAI